MVPRRGVLTSDRWFDALSDWQAERELIREHLDVLKTTIGRLHALRPAYQELLDHVQVNIQALRALQSNLNIFASILMCRRT